MIFFKGHSMDRIKQGFRNQRGWPKVLLFLFLSVFLLVFITGYIPFSSPKIRNTVSSILQKSYADSCSIGKLSISLWRGVALDSLYLTKIDSVRDTLVVRASSARVAIRAFPLLFKHVVIRNVRIENPEILVRQRKKTKVVAPPLDFSAFIPAPDKMPKLPFGLSIEQARISDGSVLVTEGKEALCRIDGLDLKLGLQNFSAINVFLRMEKVRSGNLVLRDAKARVTLGETELLMDEGEAEAFGGKILLSLRIGLRHKILEELTLDLMRLDLEKMYRASGNGTGKITGKMDGSFRLERSVLLPDSIRGNGSVKIRK